MAGVEDWLPEFDVFERHTRVVAAEPERALDLALALPPGSDRVVAALLRLRGLRRSATAQEFFRAHGFVELARTPTEYVAGTAGAPWRPAVALARLADGAAFRVHATPGTVRIAFDFRAEPHPGGGSLLSTETRIAAVDERARRAFRRYWLVVGPFSALIRRRWLRAVALRSATPRPPGRARRRRRSGRPGAGP